MRSYGYAADALNILTKPLTPHLPVRPGHRSTSDIICHTVFSSSFLTDAGIDESCNRTHYGSKRVNGASKSITAFYKRL